MKRRNADAHHHAKIAKPTRWNGKVMKGQRLYLDKLGELCMLDESYPQLVEWNGGTLGRVANNISSLVFRGVASGRKELMDDSVDSGKKLPACVG